MSNKQACTITQISQMQSVGAAIREMLLKGPVRLQFKPAETTRSEAQNRLMWMWHGELKAHILEHQGEVYDTGDIHEYIIGKLLPRKAVTINNEPIIIRASTSKLPVKPFAEMLTLYEAFAAETYQCIFNRPDDLYWQAMGISR